jgi:hypothetical protein
MKTVRLSVEIMGPDKSGNGGIKITEKGKLVKWFYHNRRTPSGLMKLKASLIRKLSSVPGVS